MQSIKRREGTILIAVLQYLYLFYYLNYQNAFFSNEIILIVALASILLNYIFRFCLQGQAISPCIYVAFIGSIFCFACSAINGSGFGSSVTQATVLLSIAMFPQIRLSRKQWQKITLRMSAILAVILLLFSKTDKYGVYHLPILPYFGGDVVMNPNGIACLLFFLLAFLCQFLANSKIRTRMKSFLLLAVGVIIIIYSLETGSRTSSLAMLVMFACILMGNKSGKKRYCKLFPTLIIGSLVLTFVYVLAYQSGFLIDVKIFGKYIYSGRQEVWLDGLQLLKNNLLFGFSNKTAFGSGEWLSLHNSMLAHLCYFGIFGALVTIFVFCSAFSHKTKNRATSVSTFAILCSTFIMCFETLTTDWSMAILLCFLFLSVQEKEGERLL